MFEKILIWYWHSPLPLLKDEFPHSSEYEYTWEKRNEIVDKILQAGYSAMLKKGTENTLIIYIDNGRFGQR